MNESKTAAVLVAVGRDRPGLANAMSKRLHEGNCTIIDARMETVGAYFAILIQFSGAAAAVQAVRDEVRDWGDKHRLDIRIYEHLPGREEIPGTLLYDLRVDAIERAGVIDDISRFFTKHGVNVVRLEGRLADMPFSGEARFVMEALLEIPQEKVTVVKEALDNLKLDFVLTLHR